MAFINCNLFCKYDYQLIEAIIDKDNAKVEKIVSTPQNCCFPIFRRRPVRINRLILNDHDKGKRGEICKNHYGCTPLMVAIREENVDAVKILLSSPETVVNTHRRAFYDCIPVHPSTGAIYNQRLNLTTLMMACEKGNGTIIKLLLNDHRIIVNYGGNEFKDDEAAPLIFALKNNHADAARILLADKRIKINDQAFEEALRIASSIGNPGNIYKKLQTYKTDLEKRLGNLKYRTCPTIAK